MGISGLLPALKSIQVTKHLSEFAGQTLAVDGYVWLHRGTVACATELAVQKPTHKYVDFCMHRVRLLRYHKIEPFIVFDGGPLPAKKGTENERKKKRDEGLARGKALAAQGRHREAREYYAKCVDVTPQMAFQVIKALRAENVRYVVAPYEADAQLAYLERVGLVNGIITEDSDLLVYGCQNVLFKLDTVANTVVSIARKDFASISRSQSDISLVGWSDVQFRAMAILSGCDYLPSIPGIGLKTACALLRKWKTAEQVVRAVLLEGKKVVPRGYMDQFRLADLCFQHQRVFCPTQEKLVHLTDVDSDWDEKAEAYIGSDMDPSTAKKLAEGDIDPVTLSPMEDINPSFVPRGKGSAPVSNDRYRVDKGKSKVADTPNRGGILSFFGPNPIIPPRERRSSTPNDVKKTEKRFIGKASGKRTLVDVMESDIAAKKQKQSSKFFKAPSQGKEQATMLSAGPSSTLQNKETIYHPIEDEDEDKFDVGSCGSLDAQVDDAGLDIGLEDSFQEVVEQEDGYISPTSSHSDDIQDLSSPVRSRTTYRSRPPDSEFGAEVVSSPPAQATQKRVLQISPKPIFRTRSLDLPRVDPSSSLYPSSLSAGPFSRSKSSLILSGPDLRDSFADRSSEINSCDEASGSKSPPTPTPSPPTPLDQEQHLGDLAAQDYDPDDPEVVLALDDELRNQAVMNGWRKRWALDQPAKLQRRETNITPAGRHKIPRSHSQLVLYSNAAPNSVTKVTKMSKVTQIRPQARKSLPLFQPIIKGTADDVDSVDLSPDLGGSEDEMASMGKSGCSR